jgi:hypothetical protein
MAPRSKASVPKTVDDEGELDWDRDLEGFEEVEVSLGEKIEWSETPDFLGVYLGSDEIMAPDMRTGELIPVKVHNFKDRHGELCFAWHSPELDRGLRKADVGWEVAIRWLGKDKPKGAKNDINRFRVAVKAPTI